jgi:hypothetical protein
VEELSLFAPEPGSVPDRPTGDRPVRMRVLITVKAAPNPSERYGETVCVAGIRLDLASLGSWVRLYPINFRELADNSKFNKYDIVSLEARPSRGDPRRESWRPQMSSLTKEGHLRSWARRKPYITSHVTASMCDLIAAVRDNPPAQSLAAVRPRQVTSLDIEPHPGWTADEQAKINRYMSQLELEFELPGLARAPHTALDAPRFKGWYRYLCQATRCPGHRQGIYDWEWVALQRRLGDRDDAAAKAAMREKFLDMICAPNRDVMFFVGNQAKHPEGFIVLGAFYPRR